MKCLRMLLASGLLVLLASNSWATNISGTTTINSDVSDGIVATGGSAGSTLTVNSGVTVTTNDPFGIAIDFQAFPYTLNNNGEIGEIIWTFVGYVFGFPVFEPSGNSVGVFFSGDGTVINNDRISAVAGAVGINGTGTIINNGRINSIWGTGITLGSGTIINSVHGEILGDNYGIQILNSATVINSGRIVPGSGFAAILGGTGDDTIILRTGSDINGDINTADGNDQIILEGTGSYWRNFINAESLTLSGTHWTLTGFSTIGNTVIDQGLLELKSTLTSPVTINPLGILGGTGKVTGHVANNGTLTPGSSIGTFTIDGHYTHESTGHLKIEFNDSANDLLNVTGTATLNGGTVSFLPSGPVASSNTFTFLTSGGLTGSFNTVNSSLFLDTTVTQVGNDLEVTLTRNATYTSVASNGNQQKIASALDGSLATASGDLANLMLALDQLGSAGEVQDALDQMNPEPSSTFAPSSFATSQMYNNALTGRMSGLRSGAPAVSSAPAGATLLAMNSDNSYQLVQTLSGSRFNADTPAQRTGGWNAFVRTFGSTATLDSEVNHVGFDANTYGVIFGGDKLTSDRWIVGGSLGFSATGQEFEQSNWDSDVTSIRLAGNAGYTAKRWYWDGILSYAYNMYSSTRTINVGGFNRVAEGDHGGHEFSLYNGVGYKLFAGQWQYGPIASVQYITLMEDSYEEEGAGTAGLKFDSINTHSLRSTVGGFINRTITFDSGMRLIPEARAQWAHEWMDTEFTTTAQFVGGAGGSFEIQGRDLGTDSVFAGAGATAYWSDRFLTALNYNIDVGRTGFTSHMFDLRLAWRF